MGKSWKTAGKVEKAMQKGLVFTKLAREISVAAKVGGPDPAANSRLRLAIDAAKKQSCPTDTIERAIKKGAGLLDDGKIIEEVVYEGYGPHGVGVIVECQTDNKHRTAPDMRHAFKSHEGNMGETGSVAWMFEHVGYLVANKTGTFDPDEEAIEAGANEVYKDEDGSFEFYTSMTDLISVSEALTKRGWKVTTAELSYKAKNITELSAEQKKDVEEFLNYLDDMDDTHRVHATI
ncbi:MAG: YebC/PmpR family DNA-binding transcriptional regulator [Bdellovibrionaceae bacterium]|nr:YebC/PmpR family DNA-binding transcriptional regulator [Pseudobdellovibrionaceae bacterium]